jgi:hypothetical protein
LFKIWSFKFKKKKKHFLTHKNKTVCHYMFAIATWKRD